MARRQFPKDTLKKALMIAAAIQEKNAGKPMKRLLLADAIGIKPASTNFKYLLSSSYKYGLTAGTEKAESITLTELGRRITKPKSSKEEIKAKQEALLTPELFRKIYTYYKSSKYPAGRFFENTLETEFGVPREHVKELESLLEKNGKYVGIIRDISGSPHVLMDELPPVEETIDAEEPVEEIDAEGPDDLPTGESSAKETEEVETKKLRPIFIAHGKNKKPLEQLKKILDQFKIPYKVAVDEPHSGRPISQKVRELMTECGSAIFIFSKEKEESDEEGKIIPNLNVVFELGAASVLYGDKIVIFKEGDIKFSASDFSNLGYIVFEENKLEAKAMELLKELIDMGYVEFAPAS